MNISLPDRMKAFVESQVSTGQFSNASDYIRDLIREREAGVERLRALIEEGEASGYVTYDFAEIMRDIRERHQSPAA
jgi:antitoxin ParD1/3/4